MGRTRAVRGNPEISNSSAAVQADRNSIYEGREESERELSCSFGRESETSEMESDPTSSGSHGPVVDVVVVTACIRDVPLPSRLCSAILHTPSATVATAVAPLRADCARRSERCRLPLSMRPHTRTHIDAGSQLPRAGAAGSLGSEPTPFPGRGVKRRGASTATPLSCLPHPLPHVKLARPISASSVLAVNVVSPSLQHGSLGVVALRVGGAGCLARLSGLIY